MPLQIKTAIWCFCADIFSNRRVNNCVDVYSTRWMELALGHGNFVGVRYCRKWVFILPAWDTKISFQQEQRENPFVFKQNRQSKQTNHNYNLRVGPNLATRIKIIRKQILPHRPFQIQIPENDHYFHWVCIFGHTNHLLLYITQPEQCRVQHACQSRNSWRKWDCRVYCCRNHYQQDQKKTFVIARNGNLIRHVFVACHHDLDWKLNWAFDPWNYMLNYQQTRCVLFLVHFLCLRCLTFPHQSSKSRIRMGQCYWNDWKCIMSFHDFSFIINRT